MWDFILVAIGSTWYWVVVGVFFVVSFIFLVKSWSKKIAFIASIFVGIFWPAVVLAGFGAITWLVLMKDSSKKLLLEQNKSPNKKQTLQTIP